MEFASPCTCGKVGGWCSGEYSQKGKQCELHQEVDRLMELARVKGKALRDEYSKIRVEEARLKARKEDIQNVELSLNQVIPELVSWKKKLTEMHEFVLLIPDNRRAHKGDAQVEEVRLMGPCKVRGGCVAAVADEALPAVIQACRGMPTRKTTLKRKIDDDEPLPEEVAQPPRKKVCKRRHQPHTERPDYRCLVLGCTYIGKNDHVHRHLRSGKPRHGISDIALHDTYMVKIQYVLEAPVSAKAVSEGS